MSSLEAISKAQSSLEASMSKKFAEFELALQSASPESDTIATLKAELHNFKNVTSAILHLIRQQISTLSSTVDQMEMRHRRKCVLLAGVPESDNENVTEVVTTICRDQLRLAEVSPSSFSVCHRLGQAVAGRSRSILVRCSESAFKDALWRKKTSLKGTRIVMSEFLTHQRQVIFLEARKHFGMRSVWTLDGTIFIKPSSGKTIRVVTAEQLQKVMNDHPAVTPAQTSVRSSEASASEAGQEVTGADSSRATKQAEVYKGLDVVTAKATAAERALAPHHLLDMLEPHQNFTVVDFRNRALKIIQELTEKGKIPIIVGGTNYYMESIVYNILVEDMSDSEELLWNRSTRKRDVDDAGPSTGEPNAKNPAIDVKNEDNDEKSATELNKDNKSKPVIDITEKIDKEKVKYEVDNERLLTNEDIHLRLMSIDPVMAERLHPNNRRKMLRSIEVWLKTGRRHSDILEEQKQREGRLRRPGATILLWLRCEQKVHDERLDTRVDSMLDQGLIQELLDFHQRHNRQRLKDGKPPDYTRGIFQTLGFKEFHEYLMLTEEERQGRPELMRQSIDNMKMGTRRYARRQNKMVRGRFLDHPNREVPPIYELDTTDITAWDTQVKQKAIHIIESYLNGTPCRHEPLTSETRGVKKDINPFSNNYCEICKRVLIGDKEYGIHLQSNRHMKVLKKRKLEKKKLESQADSDNV